MIAFVNDFHGTEAKRNWARGDNVTAGQELRLRKALCPVWRNCECSGPGGIRGGDAVLEAQPWQFKQPLMFKVVVYESTEDD